MDDPKPKTVPQTYPSDTRSFLRRLAECLILCVCFLLLLRTLAIEPYEVPTGSMAPALLGHHKATTCPQCGYPVRVGLVDPPAEPAEVTPMAMATCPNCGCGD